MKLQRRGCPSDDLGQDDLDPAMNDNLETLVSDEANDFANLSWSLSGSWPEVASYADGQVEAMTVNDLIQSAPCSLMVELRSWRGCDDCLGLSGYEYDGLTRPND